VTIASGTGTGAVYDRGYRPYDGPRGGRSAARMALFRASVRRALGLRRSWRQKVAPLVLLGIVVIPAIVNVGAKYLTRNTPGNDVDLITYREYVGVSNALLVFVALTAPDLMCPDRRQRVLPLLFARPMTGVDYVVAKVGAMFAILFAFSFFPQIVLFVGQMLVADDGALAYARDNAEVLWQVPLAVAALALFYASIGMAIASLTSRRITAGASIVGVFLVTSIISGVLSGEATDSDVSGSAAALLDLLSLPLVLRDLVFLGHVDPDFSLSGVANGGLWAVVVYAAVVVTAIAALVVRYDEIER
jgi:ABC-2 type transport system permease protein